jgi:transposase-like protein/ribosomal protein L37AE/L43A
MDDYPRNLQEFDARFGTEEACRNYLVKLRWPEGFICPHCGETKAWAVREVLWQCAGCAKQVSVTAGTIFQDTRTPLRVWFQAMWWLTTQKNGASALGLQRILGLKHYQTAWTWLHKLRGAMVRPGRDLLCGRIEVDEAYLGGLEEVAPGRATQNKALIGVAVEENKTGSGRIRLRILADASAQSLGAFIGSSIAPGSVVHTDGWSGYAGLNKLGYTHEVSVVRSTNAHELLPRTHRVISLLKRWLLGTHQGAVGYKHLDYYLDEFTFRFNRRTSLSRGKLFYRLVQQSVMVEPRTYRMIVDQVKPVRSTARKPPLVGVT